MVNTTSANFPIDCVPLVLGDEQNGDFLFISNQSSIQNLNFSFKIKAMVDNLMFTNIVQLNKTFNKTGNYLMSANYLIPTSISGNFVKQKIFIFSSKFFLQKYLYFNDLKTFLFNEKEQICL